MVTHNVVCILQSINRRVIVYPLGQDGQTLNFADAALAHFKRHRQIRANQVEAGGQLFASIAGSAVTVQIATGPRRGDQRSPTAYVPNRRAENKEIARMFDRGLHYVGDWHTHRECRPVASYLDAQSIHEIFRRSRHQLAGMVIAIVGIELPPAGLLVAITNGRILHTLSPLPTGCS